MKFVWLLVLWAVLGVTSATAGRGIDDWWVDNFPEGMYAATLNDSGNLLGQYCFTEKGNCMWILGMKTGCEADHKYPILVNSDTGARTLEVFCGGQLESGQYRYFFSEFDAIDNIVRGSSRIGFAAPLKDDQFQVVRFSLRGGRVALDRMRAAAEGAAKPVRKDTRDQRL
jgi:hypothetical protein